MVILMTAASPTVLYLATGLFAEPLFALLLTASLLALLDERPLIAGLCLRALRPLRFPAARR